MGAARGWIHIAFVAWAVALAPSGSFAAEVTRTGPATVRFRGQVYETRYERQIENGTPLDIYFFQTPPDGGVPAVANGQQLWNRFVRDPAADHPDQSQAVWWFSKWEYRKGAWQLNDTRGVVVEVVSTSSPPSAPGGPPIAIRSVNVRPSRVAPGQEVVFAAVYDVAGVAVQVVERREIVKDGQVLASWEDAFMRSPGETSSEKPVRVASQASPGSYTARLTVLAGGSEYHHESTFDVQ
jgi:hypothetical protein